MKNIYFKKSTYKNKAVRSLALFIFSIFVLSSSQSVQAQVDYTFWFVAPEVTNQHGDEPIGLKITSFNQASQAVISMPAEPAFAPITVNIAANQTVNVNLTPFKNLLENQPGGVILNKGLLIEATNPVTCYYEVNRVNNPDIFTLKGQNALDTAFFVPAQTTFPNGVYNPVARNSFEIVATEDNTQVTIFYTTNVVGIPTNPITITLNRGQTYSVVASSHVASFSLAGSKVTSNKKIAITIKDDSVAPGGTWGGCRDLMGDQIIGLKNIGMEYIIVKGPPLNGGNTDHIYITATQNGTDVFIDGNPIAVATLNEGETHLYNTITNPTAYITSSAPVYVLHVTGFGCELGQAVIPPIGCSGSTEVAFTRSDAAAGSYFGLILFTKNGAQGNFTLNGAPLTPAQIASFSVVPGTGGAWVGTRIDLSAIVPTAGTQSLIANSTEIFHAGIINGGASTGCRYGYFSGFTTIQLGRDRSFCLGDTVILDAGVGKDSYLWSTNDTTRYLHVVDSGLYYVYATIAQCDIYDTVHLSFYPVIDTVLRDTSICNGSNVEIFAASGFNYTYLWDNALATQNRTINLAGTYSVMVSDTNGCHRGDTMVLSIDALPTPLAPTNLPTQCVQNDTFSIIGSAPPAGIIAYWTGNGIDSLGVFDPGLANAGQHPLYYTFVDTTTPGNCTATDTTTIAVIPLVITSNDTSICFGAAAIQIINFPSGGNWLGPFNNNIDTTGAQANGYITYNPQGIAPNPAMPAPRKDTLIYQFSNDTGCTNQDTTIIDVFVVPPTDTLLIRQCADAQNSNSAIFDLTGYDTIFKKGLVIDVEYYTNPARTTIANPANAFSLSNGDTIYVTTIASGGCNNTFGYIAFTIDTLPTLDFGNDTIICSNETILLFAGNLQYHYLWNDNTHDNFKNINQSGIYSNIKTDTINNCISADTISITVNQIPNLNLGFDDRMCENYLPYVLDAGAEPNHSYVWNTSDLTPVIPLFATGQYIVTKTNTITNCFAIDTFNFIVDTLPIFTIGIDTNICRGDTINISSNINPQNYFFLWLNDTSTAASFAIDTPGVVILRVNTTYNCFAEDTVIIDFNNTPPTTICKDTSVYLNQLGYYVIDSSYIDNGSFDTCGILSMQVSIDTLTCVHLGITQVTLTVYDVDSFFSTCVSNVTVLDSIKPTPQCKNDTIYLDANGLAQIDTSNINNGSFDNCAVDTMWLSQYQYTCADTGINSVYLYVQDQSGNYDSCLANVLILDTIRPTAICKNDTIYLDANGLASIDTTNINNNSFDNCVVDTMWLSQYQFTCADTGQNTVSLYVRDVSGNTDSCTATVLVLDTIPPTAICKNDTIYLDASGLASIDTTNINNGSFDNCAVDTMWLSQYQFTCADTGQNTVSLFVQDVSGNIDSCNAIIVVLDTIPPTPICKNDTIYLDANGLASVDTSNINNASFDNCALDTMWLSNYNYNCTNTGINAIKLFVQDVSGNVDSCNAFVIVLDTIPPTPICKSDTILLDTNGQASITVANINDASFDNCAIDTMWLSRYTFSCADTGTNAVTLFVRDVSGNIDSCVGNIVVRDTVPPIIICPANITQGNDTNTCDATVTIPTPIVFDSCGIQSVINSFNNTNNASGIYALDTTLITWTVTDYSGNQASCQMQVIVQDTQAPVIVCPPNIYEGICNNPIVYAPPVGTDNCLGAITVLTAGLGSGANFPLGTTTETYTVTDTAGNIASCSFTVQIDTLPTISLGIDTNICPHDSLLLDAGGPASAYTYLWSTSATSQFIYVNTADTFYVTKTDTNLCSVFDTLIVGLDTLPFISLVDTSICEGETAVLDYSRPGPLFYSWSHGPTTPIISLDSGGVYELKLVDTVSLCYMFDTMIFIVNSLPNVNFGPDTNICDGTLITLNAGGPFHQYAWNVGASSQTINVDTAGTFIVTVTDVNNCVGADTIIVTVDSIPIINIGDTLYGCKGDTFTLDPGPGYLFYIWSTAQTTQTILVDSGGTYTVAVTNANNCIGVDEVHIILNPLPIFNLGNDTTICNGNTVNLNAPPNMAIYNWSTGSPNQSLPVTVSGQYWAIIMDHNNCLYSDTINIWVDSIPIVNIGPDTTICTNDTIVLNAGAGYVSYNWSIGASTQIVSVSLAAVISVQVIDSNGCLGTSNLLRLDNDTLPIINLGPPRNICVGDTARLGVATAYPLYNWSTGATTDSIKVNNSGTYTLSVTDSNMCRGSGSVQVTVNPIPFLNLGPDLDFCIGTTFNQTLDAGAGMASYQWNTGAITRAINVTSAGIFWVEIRSNQNCRNSDTIEIKQNFLPSVNLGNDTSYCANQPPFIVLDAGAGQSAYNWSTGSTAQLIFVDTAGLYRVTITDINGCSNTDQILISELPIPQVNLRGDTVICENRLINIVVTGINLGPGFSYLWSDGTTGPNFVITEYGSYSITITGPNACTNSKTMEVIREPIPIVDFRGDTLICFGSSFTLDAYNYNYAYQWHDMSNASTYEVDTPGIFSVTVTNGICTVTESAIVRLDYEPIIDLGEDKTFCYGQVDTLNASFPISNVSFEWDDGSKDSIKIVTESGLYTVQVANSCGVYIDNIYIHFDDCFNIFIPNSFTPNDDGTNEYFKVYTDQTFKKYEMRIFTRTGEVIFESSSPDVSWDGRILGKPCPIGVYTYYLKYISNLDPNEGEYEKVGTITLIR